METCINCNGKAIKHGKSSTGKQRYSCKNCHKTFLKTYTYNACKHGTNSVITRYLKEGLGIRSIARLLEISPTTILKRILEISKSITKPYISFGKCYEVDEIKTFIKHKSKRYWIVYAFQRDTKQVLDFAVGKRSNATLLKVINTLLLSNVQKIYTDKFPNYKHIIPEDIHKTTVYGTNHIERMNLTLRTHLKRLNRRTICFTRSLQMLSACLKIYFWS